MTTLIFGTWAMSVITGVCSLLALKNLLLHGRQRYALVTVSLVILLLLMWAYGHSSPPLMTPQRW
jgi:hypothetical protein